MSNQDNLPSGNVLEDLKKTGWFFIGALVIGLFASAVNARNLQTFAISLLWMLASIAFGMVIGFLFGVPKILQNPGTGNTPQQAGSSSPSANDQLSYRQQPNTNLTEISDWLTKIIAGLGLINLKKIPIYLKQYAGWMASGTNPGNPADDLAFCIAMILGFAIWGFLFGYLTTRLFLAGAFYRADTHPFSSLFSLISSTKADVGVLSVTQNALSDKIVNQKDSANVHGNVLEENQSAYLQTDPEGDLKSLSQMGTEYLQITAADWGERVRLKDAFAAKMGNFIIDKGISRDAIVKDTVETKNEGLLIALATAITLRPQPGDAGRILETGSLATRRHVRYRVLLAINAVNQQQLMNKIEKQSLAELIETYRTNADQSLLNMIETTGSLIR